MTRIKHFAGCAYNPDARFSRKPCRNGYTENPL